MHQIELKIIGEIKMRVGLRFTSDPPKGHHFDGWFFERKRSSFLIPLNHSICLSIALLIITTSLHAFIVSFKKGAKTLCQEENSKMHALIIIASF